MDKKFIQIRQKSYLDDMELDPYDTGEVTKKQLYTYFFTDFIRGSLIVGFLFLDMTLMVEPWFVVPDMTPVSRFVLDSLGGFNIVLIYYFVIMAFVQLHLVFYEMKLYSRVRKRIRDITQTD